MHNKLVSLVLGSCLLAVSFTATAGDRGRDKGEDRVNLAINPDTVVLYMKSDITEGNITGFNCAGDCVDNNGDGFPDNAVTITWAYRGDVYAADVDDDSGEQEGIGELVGTVTGSPEFPAAFGIFTMVNDPKAAAAMLGTETLPWTCNGCNLQIGGSTFAKIDSMPLTGRSFIALGAVPNAENKLALRMGGCAGVQETSGTGKYANMAGTICLNGTIGFNPDFSGVGTSNCVMVLQPGPYSPIIQ